MVQCDRRDGREDLEEERDVVGCAVERCVWVMKKKKIKNKWLDVVVG